MDFLNKKSLFFLIAITLFICSSYATNLPQAHEIGDDELVDVDGFGNLAKSFIHKLGEFLSGDRGRSAREKAYQFGMRFGDVYEAVTYVCMERYKCEPPQHRKPFCRAYCVYQIAKKTAKVASCQQKCQNQPPPNCVYKSNSLSCH